MKHLSQCVSPFKDETLSSWLYRISLQRKIKGINRINILPNVEMQWDGPVPHSIDFDFDFTSDFFKNAALITGFSSKTITKKFEPQNHKLVSWARRTLFCKSCLSADIASGQLPGWRKSWCYRESMHCVYHREELVSLEQAPTISKSWDAFVQNVHAVHPKPTINVERLSLLCFNLSHRIFKRKKACSLTELELFRKLSDVFLMARTFRSRAGVAHYTFGSRSVPFLERVTSYADSIEYGAEVSGARAKYGSLFMAAYLMDLLTDSEIDNVGKVAGMLNIFFPSSKSIIPTIYFGCSDVSDYEYLHGFFGVFKRIPGSKIDNLFARLERDVGQRIFCRDFKFGSR
ncbi:TniQ family protein [Pseudomonas sp. W5-01]|uniref:TniQ family protein n=1 Tax=Pseudomonas sp. W5-01 TaxID=3097454 RepID=UPI00397D4196